MLGASVAGKGRAHQMEGTVPAKTVSSKRAGTILTGGVCKGQVWEQSGEDNGTFPGSARGGALSRRSLTCVYEREIDGDKTLELFKGK